MGRKSKKGQKPTDPTDFLSAFSQKKHEKVDQKGERKKDLRHKIETALSLMRLTKLFKELWPQLLEICYWLLTSMRSSQTIHDERKSHSIEWLFLLYCNVDFLFLFGRFQLGH